MPKTLLNGVNDVAKKLQLIKGQSGEFSTLTGLAQQYSVDVIITNWNVAIEDLYSKNEQARPNELSSTEITLTQGIREYDLPSDLLDIRWPLHNETTGEYITEYEDGFHALTIQQQIPTDYTGLPHQAVVRPTDGKLYMDYIPQAAQNGMVFKRYYDKNVSLSVKEDEFPFNDATYRAMVNVVAELSRRDLRSRFDAAFYRKFVAQAGRYLNKNIQRTSYIKKGGGKVAGDPYA